MFPLVTETSTPYRPPRKSDSTWIEGELYYRDSVPEEAEILQAARDGTLDLRIYQQWVEFGWKTPIGSLDSAARFAKKMNEEITELIDAYLEYTTSPDEITRQHLLEEAGDVAWVLTAIASNGGEGITRMTRLALCPGKENEDSFILNDMVNTPIPPCDDMPELNSAHPLLRLRAETLVYAIEGFKHHLLDARVPLEQYELATWGAQYAYKYPYLIAQLHAVLRELGLSLNEAIAGNISKISDRRIANTLDKSDPGRS